MTLCSVPKPCCGVPSSVASSCCSPLAPPKVGNVLCVGFAIRVAAEPPGRSVDVPVATPGGLTDTEAPGAARLPPGAIATEAGCDLGVPVRIMDMSSLHCEVSLESLADGCQDPAVVFVAEVAPAILPLMTFTDPASVPMLCIELLRELTYPFVTTCCGACCGISCLGAAPKFSLLPPKRDPGFGGPLSDIAGQVTLLPALFGSPGPEPSGRKEALPKELCVPMGT
mmetsp:Transcript_2070/g.8058  ORF Transcript_2070/g.8058 Transcript_2070/m.8058 type:complete len:226 (+) Transcript_2070:1403-2080(+)